MRLGWYNGLNSRHQEICIYSIRIGEVTTENLTEVIQLAELVWWNHYPGIISNEQIEYMLSRGYNKETITHELEGGTIHWVTMHNEDELIGFASYGPISDGEEMQLYKLYIHPGFQRTGCGTALMHYLQEKATENGHKHLVLTVNKHNHNAISAYLKNGFVIREPIITDIGNGFYMDDYIMHKCLV